MIQWLRNRSWNKRRLLFRFHDGRRTRSVDPVEIAMALHSHDVFLYQHLIDAADGDVDSQKVVAQTACDVFGVHPLDSDHRIGLTIAERIELVMAFDLYLMSLKKSIDPTLTPPSFTESTSKESESATTSATSDSGSTENDPPSDPPTSGEPATSPSTAS